MLNILSQNINKLTESFKLSIVVHAFAVGILISLCAALLGVILVLKHYSLIGHGLADVGFAAMSAAVGQRGLTNVPNEIANEGTPMMQASVAAEMVPE